MDWPFFEEPHRQLKQELVVWASAHIHPDHTDESSVDAQCRTLVYQLGQAGWLRHAIAGKAYGALNDSVDTRSICLLREELAWHHGLADFAFAMQGLGSGAICLFGSELQKQHYLPRVAQGSAIAAFALSEPEAGSDVAAMRCSATREGDDYILNGEKTWISNGGIADFYVVFARTDDAPGAKGISAFIVDASCACVLSTRVFLRHNALEIVAVALKWRWPRWMSFAPLWRQPHWALPRVPCTSHWPG